MPDLQPGYNLIQRLWTHAVIASEAKQSMMEP
jgi:hypothetical protein